MTSAVLTRLNAEWQRLCRDCAPRVVTWTCESPPLQGCADLTDVLARLRADPDAVLTVLLRLGRRGDELAWRTVMQAMLGKAVCLSGGDDDRLAEAVSELWLLIAEYPLDRRPRSIAANLAWGLQRRLAPRPVELLPSAPPRREADETLREARSLGLLDEVSHRTLWLVYVQGLSSADAAGALGISPELVRYRCSRSLRRLSKQAELLAA